MNYKKKNYRNKYYTEINFNTQRKTTRLNATIIETKVTPRAPISIIELDWRGGICSIVWQQVETYRNMSSMARTRFPIS